MIRGGNGEGREKKDEMKFMEPTSSSTASRGKD